MLQMPKRSLSDLVLESIDTISARKNRPNLVRIYRHLHRLYDLSFQTCETLLQSLLKQGKVIPVTYKGNISYRNALKWKKYSYYMKKTMESELPGTLLTNAISELVIIDVDYLKNGVPWNVLQHHLLSSKDGNINEEALKKLLQRELKLGSMSRMPNGNYFLGQNPVKPRVYENKTLKFEPVRRSITSEEINFLSTDKVENLYASNHLYGNNEINCDKESNDLSDGRSRDVPTFRSGEPSPNSSSEFIQISECQEVVIAEDSCNGYNSVNGMIQKLSDYKLSEESEDSDNENVASSEVEIPISSPQNIPMKNHDHFEGDIELEDEEVLSQNTDGMESNSLDNNNVIELENDSNFDVSCRSNLKEDLKIGYEFTLKGKTNVNDNSYSIKDSSKYFEVDECSYMESSAHDKNKLLRNSITYGICNYEENSLVGNEYNSVVNDISNGEYNSNNSSLVDDESDSNETLKIDESYPLEEMEVSNEINPNEVVIDDLSSSSSKVDTINSSETQEKSSDNDEEEALEDEEQVKQQEKKAEEIVPILGRVRRQKKKKYDDSDYYFPSLKRKSREVATEQEKKDDKRKKKKKKKDSSVVNNGCGISAKNVMFPGNVNMCSECKCYKSKEKLDTMVVCASCNNEGHQSCAKKCMTGDRWVCIDCRQDIEQCKICKKTSQQEKLGLLYSCSNCGCNYHKRCHNPSIKDSFVKWHCFRCPPLLEDELVSSEDSFDIAKKAIETMPLAESKTEKCSYFSDEPPDPSNWTTSEVYSYFRKYFEEDVAKTILEQDIDGFALKLLKRGDILKLDFKLGTCLKLLLHIKRLQLQSNNLIEIWRS